METVATFKIEQETFTATGVMIIERNFLDVYPYVKWETKLIPQFQQGERIMPTELNLVQARLLPMNNRLIIFDHLLFRVQQLLRPILLKKNLSA